MQIYSNRTVYYNIFKYFTIAALFFITLNALFYAIYQYTNYRSYIRVIANGFYDENGNFVFYRKTSERNLNCYITSSIIEDISDNKNTENTTDYWIIWYVKYGNPSSETIDYIYDTIEHKCKVLEMCQMLSYWIPVRSSHYCRYTKKHGKKKKLVWLYELE